jgi:hypothetical protein
MQWRMVAPTTQARSTGVWSTEARAGPLRGLTGIRPMLLSRSKLPNIGETMAAMHYNETLARRIVAEVDHVTAGRPVRWVTLQHVARRLKVHHSSAAAAVRVAVDGGWLIAEGSPPHSVCRTEIGRTLPQPDSPYAKEHSTEAPKKPTKPAKD